MSLRNSHQPPPQMIHLSSRHLFNPHVKLEFWAPQNGMLVYVKNSVVELSWWPLDIKSLADIDYRGVQNHYVIPRCDNDVASVEKDSVVSSAVAECRVSRGAPGRLHHHPIINGSNSLQALSASPVALWTSKKVWSWYHGWWCGRTARYPECNLQLVGKW